MRYLFELNFDIFHLIIVSIISLLLRLFQLVDGLWSYLILTVDARVVTTKIKQLLLWRAADPVRELTITIIVSSI